MCGLCKSPSMGPMLRHPSALRHGVEHCDLEGAPLGTYLEALPHGSPLLCCWPAPTEVVIM